MAISYTKVGWDTSKYVNPTNMNQMDNGIKAACDGVDALDTEMGTTSISGIGDGTVTGAINTINTDLTQLDNVEAETIDATLKIYARKRGNVVTIYGNNSSNRTVTSSWTNICTVPEEYRPFDGLYTSNYKGDILIYIGPNGSLEIKANSTASVNSQLVFTITCTI